MPRQLPDYLRPGLAVVFVGFNPGERSARLGHYYAGRGNQFWNFLFESGLLKERLTYSDDHRVLEFGLGLTDLVKRPSRKANELPRGEFADGRTPLVTRLLEVANGCRVVAFNGKGACERFCGHAVELGWQPERMVGARVFVLPCTAGTNVSLTRAAKLRYFRRLARWVKRDVQ